MNKRKRTLLIAVFALILCALGLVLYISHEPPEPSYKGKPLTYWLEGYTPRLPRHFFVTSNSIPGRRPTEQEANEAIHSMGTNSIPHLLRMFQYREPGWRITFRKLLQKQHLIKISLDSDPLKNHETLGAFKTLGRNASNAVPTLIKIFHTDPSPFPQMTIPTILAEIDPDGEQVIPTLLEAATNTNSFVRDNAVYSLGQIHAKPELAVPALIRSLNDPDTEVQKKAIWALARFHEKARPAVPALLDLWRNPALSNIVSNALFVIDAKAAIHAGIK